MLRIKGIDISRAQEVFDFDAAEKAGVKFVIIRAGIRADMDTYFRDNLSECLARGIPYGLYWYFEATDYETFYKELAACKNAIKGLKPQYPVFFDMETQEQIDKLDRKTRTDMAIRFCEEMTAIGLPSGIYANPSWMETYFEKDRLVGKYDIWLSHWTESPDYPSRYDYGQAMWQWGCDFIDGKDVDGNICFIDYPAKTAYWYSIHTQGEDEPDKPEQSDTPEPTQPTADLRKGDEVTLKNAPLYGASTSKSKATTVNGTYWIHSDGVINGRIRITTPHGCSDCTGWVNVADCKHAPVAQEVPAAQPTPSLKVGDTVRVKVGAKTYNGGMLMAFVYTQTYEVMQVGVNGQPDYIVIGQGGEITAAVHAYDLIA